MFNGRIDRTGFILGSLYQYGSILAIIILYGLFNLLTVLAGVGQGEFRSGINILLYLLGFVWIVGLIPVSVGLSIRRWHDMNESGWFYLFYFLPIVGNFVFFVQVFARGSGDEPNRFGQKLSPRGFDRVIFGPHKEDIVITSPAPLPQAPVQQQVLPVEPPQPPTSTQI
jgi:uncharacterized membrane protein YhaH (DUF805 family)